MTYKVITFALALGGMCLVAIDVFMLDQQVPLSALGGAMVGFSIARWIAHET